MSKNVFTSYGVHSLADVSHTEDVFFDAKKEEYKRVRDSIETILEDPSKQYLDNIHNEIISNYKETLGIDISQIFDSASFEHFTTREHIGQSCFYIFQSYIDDVFKSLCESEKMLDICTDDLSDIKKPKDYQVALEQRQQETRKINQILDIAYIRENYWDSEAEAIFLLIDKNKKKALKGYGFDKINSIYTFASDFLNSMRELSLKYSSFMDPETQKIIQHLEEIEKSQSDSHIYLYWAYIHLNMYLRLLMQQSHPILQSKDFQNFIESFTLVYHLYISLQNRTNISISTAEYLRLLFSSYQKVNKLSIRKITLNIDEVFQLSFLNEKTDSKTIEIYKSSREIYTVVEGLEDDKKIFFRSMVLRNPKLFLGKSPKVDLLLYIISQNFDDKRLEDIESFLAYLNASWNSFLIIGIINKKAETYDIFRKNISKAQLKLLEKIICDQQDISILKELDMALIELLYNEESAELIEEVFSRKVSLPEYAKLRKSKESLWDIIAFIPNFQAEKEALLLLESEIYNSCTADQFDRSVKNIITDELESKIAIAKTIFEQTKSNIDNSLLDEIYKFIAILNINNQENVTEICIDFFSHEQTERKDLFYVIKWLVNIGFKDNIMYQAKKVRDFMHAYELKNESFVEVYPLYKEYIAQQEKELNENETPEQSIIQVYGDEFWIKIIDLWFSDEIILYISNLWAIMNGHMQQWFYYFLEKNYKILKNNKDILIKKLESTFDILAFYEFHGKMLFQNPETFFTLCFKTRWIEKRIHILEDTYSASTIADKDIEDFSDYTLKYLKSWVPKAPDMNFSAKNSHHTDSQNSNREEEKKEQHIAIRSISQNMLLRIMERNNFSVVSQVWSHKKLRWTNSKGEKITIILPHHKTQNAPTYLIMRCMKSLWVTHKQWAKL